MSKPPFICTGKWRYNLTCTSAMSQLQLPCNFQLVISPSWNTKLSEGTPRTCMRFSVRNFVFQEADLTSWTVTRKLQLAHCYRAGQIAASFPSTIQRGFYHREVAFESRSGKIATSRRGKIQAKEKKLVNDTTHLHSSQLTKLSCGLDVGSWVSTDMYLDNYEIQKNGTNINVLYGAVDCWITYRRWRLVLFQT